MKGASHVGRLFFCALLLSPRLSLAEGAIQQAQAQFRLDLLIEGAGLFWIGAELAILFCMTVAVRMFSQRPIPGSLILTTGERRSGVALFTLFLLLATSVYLRHAFLTPLPTALGAIAEGGVAIRDGARAAYLLHAHVHVAVWCTFITGWVVLEIAIVAQGIRAYRGLGRLLSEGTTEHG